MSLVKNVRLYLGLNQNEFGVWLADEMGRDEPIHAHRISEYERRVVSIPVKVREVLMPLAFIKEDITHLDMDDFL